MKYEIVQDMFAESPRKAYENMGEILYLSSRYTLGDKQASSEEIEAVEADPENVCIPVYAYIHGGITISTGSFSCKWDSGKSGVIYASRDSIRKFFGRKRLSKKTLERAVKVLEWEISQYNMYLQGDCYGYIILDDENREIESCYGFIGMKEVEEAARDCLDFYKKHPGGAEAVNMLVAV